MFRASCIQLRSDNNIRNNLKKTKKLIVVEDGWEKFSVASEIISRVVEMGINLKKPPIKICWPSSHVPMSSPLEKSFYPDENNIIQAFSSNSTLSVLLRLILSCLVFFLAICCSYFEFLLLGSSAPE